MTTPRQRLVVQRSGDVTGASDDVFVIEQSLGYLVNALARAFARALGDRIRPHGVTPAQWAVLLVLWAEDGQTQTVLSRRVAIETPTMVRTLDRMERDGLVERRRDPRDRRRVNVTLTEHGRSLRDVLVPCAVAANEVATSDMDREERLLAVEYVRRMLVALTPLQREAG
jgi:MarR family transcriptional regulator, organic hydroperoxide resistance regulator